MKTFAVVLRKKKPDDKEGTLNLRITENRKATFQSLRVKIPVTYWNPEKGRVKATDKLDYKAINQQIETILNEYEENEKSETPIEKIKEDKESFIDYYRYLIPYQKTGSAKKYKSVLPSILDYLKTINKTDLLFKEINKEFILQFRIYLLEKRKLKTTTTARYLKHFKTVLNKAIKEDEKYTYIKHPFLTIKLDSDVKQERYLTPQQVKQLIGYLPKNDRLKDLKTKFLLQIFACGMRVSDLFLLRYGNIVNGRLDYTMYKTKQFTSIKLNSNHLKLFAETLSISDAAKKETYYSEFIKHYNAYFEYLNEISKDKPVKIGSELLGKWKKVNPDLDIQSRLEREKKYDEDKDLRYLALKLTESVTTFLVIMAAKYPDTFVFKALNPTLFKDFDITQPTKEQFDQIQARTATYNEGLKDLQKELGLTTLLTSHVARHTYTNIMLSINADVYEISKSLNHSRIAITETYLSKFNFKKVDGKNDSLSDEFSI